jgi:hypothetical protein
MKKSVVTSEVFVVNSVLFNVFDVKDKSKKKILTVVNEWGKALDVSLK